MEWLIPLVILLVVLFIGTSSFKIIGQAEVMVIERLGRFNRIARSGFNILIPFIERPRTIDVRYFGQDVQGVKRVTSGSTSRIDLPRAGAELSQPAGDHEGQRHDRHRRGHVLPRRRPAEGHLLGAEPAIRARDADPHRPPQHRG